MKPTCTFSFNLVAWQIITDKPMSDCDWQQSADYWFNDVASREKQAPKLAFLPPLKRRRLSDSARLFFEAAWDLVGEQPNIPVVYASQNSEINRSFALWQSLLQEGDVSPTSFSLSVHNALVGQWSEMRQVKAECTAITAQKDNLETALLEAYLLLNEGNERVLVVVAEDPLATQYNAQPIVRSPFAYALAMVVEKGEQYQLCLQPQAKQAVEKDVFFDNALTWVQAFYQQQNQWQTFANQGSWQWQKN